MEQKHSVVRMPRAPASESRKKLTTFEVVKKLCQCLGLASLILVMNYGDLLGGGADVRMHVPFKLTGIAAAQLMDILFLGVVLFAILLPLSRTRIYRWVKLVLAVVVPPYLIWRMQALLPDVMSDGLVPIILAVWAAVLLLLLLRFRRAYNVVMRVGDFIGIFFAAFALFSLVQLLWVMRWKPGPYEQRASWHAAGVAQPPRKHSLLVWVVFDELSYDQVFEHRAHDLALPHFDALKQISTVFTNVQPVGYKTVKIIPSLLTGKVIDDYRFRFNNSFVVHEDGTHGWQPVRGSNSIFGDAQSAGWRTAAVGWYNPYCTIYGDAIDDCYFMNLDRIDGLMSQRDTFVKNTWSPMEQIVREIRAPAKASRLQLRREAEAFNGSGPAGPLDRVVENRPGGFCISASFGAAQSERVEQDEGRLYADVRQLLSGQSGAGRPDAGADAADVAELSAVEGHDADCAR